MNELLYKVWFLTLKGFRYERLIKIYDAAGSCKAIYEAGEELKESLGLSDFEAVQIMHKNTDKADKIVSDCQKEGVRIITMLDDTYPNMLKNISHPPRILYVKGCEMDFNNIVTVTVVGSRQPTSYGNKTSFKLGYDLAKEGVVIVSGMARGIDSQSQRGSLKAGGKTIAVLGTGCDIVYPPENKELKKIIEANGCVISEYPPGTRVMRGSFPDRNRIMSGLAMGVIVVEGGYHSGTSITTRLAAEQGRELFCVPGNIDSPLSYIPNSCIKDGCPAITTAEDVIIGLTGIYPELMLDKILKDEAERASESVADKLNREQKKIISVLSKNTPMHIDEICIKASLDAAVVNQNILMLEVNKLVASMPGRNYILR